MTGEVNTGHQEPDHESAILQEPRLEQRGVAKSGLPLFESPKIPELAPSADRIVGMPILAIKKSIVPRNGPIRTMARPSHFLS